MNLKFHIEKKDLIVFSIFSIILFYTIAVTIANISTFLHEQEFCGLNPLPAFQYNLVLTIVIFIFLIFVIFLGVQSNFFERESGIGFEIGHNKQKNYSRWAKPSEIEHGIDVKCVNPKAAKTNAGGVPLIMNKNKVYVDNGGYHNLVIGSTGAGKTQTTVLPMVNLLAKHDESMIITDPKGEIYENTSEYLKSLGYNVVLLNFRDPDQGNSWNPMYLPYSLYKADKIDKSIELLEDLAANILKDPQAKGQDPFWENTSADYFAGLSFALFEDASESEINLNSINLMTTVGEEKLGNTTYIKEYFQFKDPASTSYVKSSSTLMAPNETKGSILSVFKQRVQLFASRKNLSEMLANNDFDMRDIGRKKTAVFIVIQDEKTTYHTLVTIFLKQCYETLISVAQESGGKLKYRTNFILDEFANMPPLKDVTTMVTAARSRNIRFTFIIQNFAQLYEVYGKENGETIKGNCGNIIYLISTEIQALEEISKMCGEVKSKEKEKTSSTPLVTVSDLQRLDQWETIVLRLRTMPFKTKLTPNFQMNWGHNFPKASYPQREILGVKIFDLKSFVEKKRADKIENMLGGMGGSGGGLKKPSGFGGGIPGLPGFGGGLPGMGGGMPGLPGMGGGMPGLPGFGSMGGSKPSSPFGGGGDKKSIDDYVKLIDEKLAQIEEEEKREAEAKANKDNKNIVGDAVKEIPKEPEKVEVQVPKQPEKPSAVVTKPFDFKSGLSVEAKIESKPVVKQPEKPSVVVNEPVSKPVNQVQTKPVSNDDITDDQFFDDFFGDAD